ncbi:MAG: hypothetical protein ACM3QZ_13505 [Solirubrobacterales bacterium]
MIPMVSEERTGYGEPCRDEQFRLLPGLAAEAVDRIGNPFTVLKGILQLYQDRAASLLPWSEVNDSIVRIELFLALLRHLSVPLSANTGRPERLNQIINELYPLLESLTEQRGLWLELHLGRGAGRTTVDPAGLKLLLSLLVAQAADSLGSSGVISVYTLPGAAGPALIVTDNHPAKYSTELFDVLPGQLPGPFGPDDLSPTLQLILQLTRQLGAQFALRQIEKEGSAITVTLPGWR